MLPARGASPAALRMSSASAIGAMLKVNPEERLSVTELVNQLQEIAAARNVNPKSPITEVGFHVLLGMMLCCFRARWSGGLSSLGSCGGRSPWGRLRGSVPPCGVPGAGRQSLGWGSEVQSG